MSKKKSDFPAIAARIIAELEANGASSSEQIGLAIGLPTKSVTTYLGRLAYQKKIQRQVIHVESSTNKRLIWWPLGVEIPAEPEPEKAKRKATRRDWTAYEAAQSRIGSLPALCGIPTTCSVEKGIQANI